MQCSSHAGGGYPRHRSRGPTYSSSLLKDIRCVCTTALWRTEPYTHSLCPLLFSTGKSSAPMYCMYSLSALNLIPHCTSSATLHYTLRTPLTLPQRTELFVSLSLLSLPPLPMYMGLSACTPLAPFPLIPHPYLGLVLSWGGGGRRPARPFYRPL